MIIREAREDDLQSILEVLRASLGESSSKKTEAVWRYKHIDNPFGKSLVLLAEEDGEIVGVRAFMRWQWQLKDQVFSAFRAVDTATHPNHQGKGIFKKLTLKALEIGKVSGDHFVFNTPNDQSKPGYLKMGWEEVGKISSSIIVQSPFRFLKKNFVFEYPQNSDIQINKSLVELYQKTIEQKSKLFTPKSAEYLNWRYARNKIQSYFIYSESDCFVAAYLKDRGRIKELRISEFILRSSSGKKNAHQFIKELSKQIGANIVTISSENTKISPLQVNMKLGPTLTFKDINCTDQTKQAITNLNSWSYSLGDLELF